MVSVNWRIVEGASSRVSSKTALSGETSVFAYASTCAGVWSAVHCGMRSAPSSKLAASGNGEVWGLSQEG